MSERDVKPLFHPAPALVVDRVADLVRLIVPKTVVECVRCQSGSG
jgi:hypothetical protein